jgi:hypothetical protein
MKKNYSIQNFSKADIPKHKRSSREESENQDFQSYLKAIKEEKDDPIIEDLKEKI